MPNPWSEGCREIYYRIYDRLRDLGPNGFVGWHDGLRLWQETLSESKSPGRYWVQVAFKSSA